MQISLKEPDDVDGRPPEAESLRDISPEQWRSGIAAWLGWFFDGLDMHLYTLVALPFVAELLAVQQGDEAVGRYSSWIQAAFLFGWALGGGFFGRLGDRLGRTRALMLTILTYALFTGLSFFAQHWWHLFIFRFLAALGIGGEWAVGASLLAETWPRRWRPWLAAVLQSGVNLGVLSACLVFFVMTSAHCRDRSVFLVGVLPALLVLWIRWSVPESDEWRQAQSQQCRAQPRVADLFRREIGRTTVLTLLVCALSLTAHWAFMFWYLQHFRTLALLDGYSPERARYLVNAALVLVMCTSVLGNFLMAWLARYFGYRWVIVLGCLAYGLCMWVGYATPRKLHQLWVFFALIGTCQGLFALFTMYLPPLFPTLLRTTGAGFCYNIGRIVAGFGTVFFGLFAHVGDFRRALYYASFLFVPSAVVSCFLPDTRDTPASR